MEVRVKTGPYSYQTHLLKVGDLVDLRYIIGTDSPSWSFAYGGGATPLEGWRNWQYTPKVCSEAPLSAGERKKLKKRHQDMMERLDRLGEV